MEEENLDLISSLPFEIQQKIISFLPLKEAVRTSALSAHWNSLWSPIEASLNFDANPANLEGNPAKHEEIYQVMGTCMKSFVFPEQWKLSLNVVASSEEAQIIVAKATKGVGRELHLEFFESTKIKKDLKGLCLRKNPAKTDGFCGVKHLHLRSVTGLTGTLVSDLFSNFHVLESLKLEKCMGLQSLDVETNSLRSLVVEDCSDMVDITISAQNLKSFWYYGVLPRIVRLKNAMSLVDVVLDLRGGPGSNQFECDEFLSNILISFKDVEALTISGWILEWLCSGGVMFGYLEFQFNKLKSLTWVDSLINKDKRDSLACFLNACPSLEKLLVEIDSNLSSVPCPYFHHYWHDPHLWMDFSCVRFNTSQLRHLKSVDFLGFTAKEDELLLMDLLLEKAIRLDSFTLTSPEN